MERGAWERLKCTKCPELLEFKDVEAFATREISHGYG
jgi:hypothetical protein